MLPTPSWRATRACACFRSSCRHQLVQDPRGDLPLAAVVSRRRDLQPEGYRTVWNQGDFLQYFQNSLVVTVASLFFVLLFGAMAAFALSEYRFRGNKLMGLYLALGIMIPIRLGTVAILQADGRRPVWSTR